MPLYKVVSIYEGKRVSASYSCLPPAWRVEYLVGEWINAPFDSLLLVYDRYVNMLSPGSELWEVDVDQAQEVDKLVFTGMAAERLALFWEERAQGTLDESRLSLFGIPHCWGAKRVKLLTQVFPNPNA